MPIWMKRSLSSCFAQYLNCAAPAVTGLSTWDRAKSSHCWRVTDAFRLKTLADVILHGVEVLLILFLITIHH
jgi:hypothetical protein